MQMIINSSNQTVCLLSVQVEDVFKQSLKLLNIVYIEILYKLCRQDWQLRTKSFTVVLFALVKYLLDSIDATCPKWV